MLQIEMEFSTEALTPQRRIFWIYHTIHKFSIFSLLSHSNRLLRYLSFCITVAIVLLLIFRFGWMLTQPGGEFLTYLWAESKMFAFISLESAILTIVLGRMGYTKSLEISEKSLKNLRTMRNEKVQKKKDDYRILWFRTLFGNLFVFLTFTLTSIYLAVNREAVHGSEKHSSWYWKMDPIAAILCGYVNFLFLPIHVLRAHAVTREFEVLNEEMAKADKEKKLANLSVLREFGARQIKMFEYTNFLTERMERFMTWTPALSILAFLMATYIVTEFSKTPPVLYLICLIAMLIATFIISFALMYPVAFIQEGMSSTSRILLNSTLLQESTDPLIFDTYRMILDRSLHNRSTNNVLHVFSVTRKNVERLFFTHSALLIVMVWTFSLDNGIAEGFEQIGKLLMMRANGTMMAGGHI